jgi:cardiolipin synthase A/B
MVATSFTNRSISRAMKSSPNSSRAQSSRQSSSAKPVSEVSIDEKIRQLRKLLKVSANGNSWNYKVLPLLKGEQKQIVKLFESETDSAAVAKLYFSVNSGRLKSALTGGENKRLRALIEKHVTTARPGDYDGLARYVDALTESKPVGPSHMKFLLDGGVVLPALRVIASAKSSIHLSVFQFAADEVGENLAMLLARKVESGVKVRVMVDEHGTFGDRKTRRRAERLIERMRAEGIEVIVNDSRGLRSRLDHRKILVVDGEEGFTGGMNIGHHYVAEWHDQQTYLRGPIVHELQQAFLDQWAAQGGVAPAADEVLFPTLPPEPEGYEGRIVRHNGRGEDRNIKATYLRAIATAQHSIRLATPYFCDSEIVRALEEAAKRGVEVQLIFPEQNNQTIVRRASQAFYPSLLKAKVEIYEYPRMAHHKVCVVDDYVVIAGSSNLDPRSLEYNDELNFLVFNHSFAESIDEKLFQVDLAKSKRIKKRRRNVLLDPLMRQAAKVL